MYIIEQQASIFFKRPVRQTILPKLYYSPRDLDVLIPFYAKDLIRKHLDATYMHTSRLAFTYKL